jgi:hypothetical protein
MARDVGDVLWPRLREVVRSARAELEALARVVRRDGRGAFAFDESRLALQEEVAARARRAGWCMGVLAAGGGVDLLRHRREADGLRWLVGALAEACGFALTRPTGELPAIADTSLEPWAISLTAGWCALQAGQRSGGAVRWTTGQQDSTRWLELSCDSVDAELERRCASLRRAGRAAPLSRLADGRLRLEWSTCAAETARMRIRG